MSFRRWVFGVSLAAGLTGCCGDNDALLAVHVVDGETGYLIADPTVTADDTELSCDDDRRFYASADFGLPGNDDGGAVVPPPPGPDGGVKPPPSKQWCQTYSVSLSAGFHTVRVSAAGYFGTAVQVDMGDGGNALSCPAAQDVETTIAIYRRPQ